MAEPEAEPDRDPSPEPIKDSPTSPLVLATAAVLRPVRNLVAFLTPAEQPLELQLLGRTLLHAALVGFGAGILGCVFFAGAEVVQNLLLEQLAGFEPLRASGEPRWGESGGATRLWLLIAIPAIGAVVAGWLMRLAPECRGGGGDATIEAFHHREGDVRPRVVWVKMLASIATLGSGGAGGREGPTMQIGGALGSTVARYLRVGARERRVLMIAGVAAGISAVFRTPFGAALLAIEMLYRDDFESEALIPALLASVIAYSVAITAFGQSTLFGHLPVYTFRPTHLPLYILLAVVVSAVAAIFVASLRASQRLARRLPISEHWRPAIGGLALGVFVVLIIHYVGPQVGHTDRGVGILGGGYGAAQAAITGADWLPLGWAGVQFLLLLVVAKIIASSMTIGSGGSVGDFAPSLAIGALVGGAFGSAARIGLDDPTIEPGAFALVGMAAFYGGIANTPLAALVLVCEMAGSYELLVPLMLAEGVAVVTLRRVSLYPAQVRTARDSPVHKRDADPLQRLRCCEVLRRERTFVTIPPETRMAELARLVEAAHDQDAFPVVDRGGTLRGVIAAEALRVVASNPELHAVGVAADLMGPPVSIDGDAVLRDAAKLMLTRDLRSLPVTAGGAIIGLLDEHDIARVMIDAAESSPRSGSASV